MAIFDLREDAKVKTWRRTKYMVEAETIEEAIEKIQEGEVGPEYSEDIYECDEYMAPRENGGESTIEIYNNRDGKLLYSNEEL